MIELLVIIAILGILVGVVVFAVGNTTGERNFGQECRDRGGRWNSSPSGDYYGFCTEP